MPFDFPSSPTNGQQVTGAAGQIYQWNGTRWVGVVPPGPLPVSSGGSGSTTAAGAPWAEKASSANNVGRNLIHNPLFNIAQRGAGPFTTTGSYTADRWQISVAGGDTASYTIVAAGPTEAAEIGDEAISFRFRNAFTGAAAATAVNALLQPIEDVRRLAGKTVTISFWANASASLKLGVSFDQSFGTGGSPSAVVNINGQSVTVATSWARYSLTFTLPSIAGKTFGTNNNSATPVIFWYSAGANNAARSGNVGVQAGVINIWGVQLEIGSTMTPLEKPDPQQDLAKCQRFYARGLVVGAVYMQAGFLYALPTTLPVTMRATPTMVITDTSSSSNLSTFGITAITLNRDVFVQGVSVATGATILNMAFTASADL